MARPTDSRIIYLQQLGRALSSDTSRDKTIVFDLVNNYLKNNLDTEINKRRKAGTIDINGDYTDINGGDDNTNIDDIDIFRIQGETQEFLELLEEVYAIIDRSDFLNNARAIKKWIDESGDVKVPNSKSDDREEKRLGTALSNLRRHLIKPYLSLQTEEEKEKFRSEHPEIDEVLEIINEIDANNVHPYIRNIRAIKEWIDKSGDTKPPSAKSSDEEERKLATMLSSIRHRLIKPYLSLPTDEEKEQYRSEHPEIDEVLEIVNEIDANNIHPYIRNIRAIKQWIDESGDTKLPSSVSKDENEKDLGMSLTRIRSYLIKPYLELQAEEEKEQFRNEHPEIEEVLKIVNEIDENNVSTYLRNAIKIKQWIDESGDIKPPNRKSDNEEEKKLAGALDRIRKKLIEPYIKLQTEEKEKFRSEHPELFEVMDIISEIDSKYVSRSKKQQELAMLVRQDLEKRKALQEAKKLEQEYEQQLSKKETKDIQEQGVDFNE